jgi:multiple sugar transport system permease protein
LTLSSGTFLREAWLNGKLSWPRRVIGRFTAPLLKTPHRRRVMAAWIFALPSVVFILAFFGYPLIYNISMSFEKYTVASFFTGDAPFVGFANYVSVFRNPVFSIAVINTVIFTVGSIALQFALGLGLAVFFNRHFPLNTLLRSFLMLPWLVPIIVSGTIFRWIYDQDFGVFNQVLLSTHLVSAPIPWLITRWDALFALLIANVWIGVPFNMVILHSGLQGIPQDLYEAAKVDGARALSRFRYITLPMLTPVIRIVLMLGLIYTLRVFDLIWIVTGGGPANATQTLATFAYAKSFRDLVFGQGAAVGNILLVVAVVFALIYVRTSRSADVAA